MSKKHSEMLKHDPVAEAIVHFLAKVKANSKVILPVSIVVVAVVVFLCVAITQGQKRPAKASMALASAAGVENLQNIVKDYSGTVAAPIALNELAKMAFVQTNFVAAIGYYDQILNDYKDFSLVPSVILAKAKCKIALGELKAAEDILTNELLYEDDDYADMAGRLTLIRVLTMQKRYKDANAEMQVLSQNAAQLQIKLGSEGLREELMRLSGASTAMVAQAEAEVAIQQETTDDNQPLMD